MIKENITLTALHLPSKQHGPFLLLVSGDMSQSIISSHSWEEVALLAFNLYSDRNILFFANAYIVKKFIYRQLVSSTFLIILKNCNWSDAIVQSL